MNEVSLGLYNGKLYLVRNSDCLGNPSLAEALADGLAAQVGEDHPLYASLMDFVAMCACRVPGAPVAHPHGHVGAFLRAHADKVQLRTVTPEDNSAVWILCSMWGELPDADRDDLHDAVVAGVLGKDEGQRDGVARAMLGRNIGDGVAKIPYGEVLLRDKDKRPGEFHINEGED